MAPCAQVQRHPDPTVALPGPDCQILDQGSGPMSLDFFPYLEWPLMAPRNCGLFFFISI